MRGLLFGFLVLSLTVALVGCHHTAGVCDCDLDDDPCATRAPWYRAPLPSEGIKSAPKEEKAGGF